MDNKQKPMRGFEPLTPALRKRCSTVELHRPNFCIYGRL